MKKKDRSFSRTIFVGVIWSKVTAAENAAIGKRARHATANILLVYTTKIIVRKPRQTRNRTPTISLQTTMKKQHLTPRFTEREAKNTQ